MSDEQKLSYETVELHQGMTYCVPEGVTEVRFDGVDYHSQGNGPKVARARLTIGTRLPLEGSGVEVSGQSVEIVDCTTDAPKSEVMQLLDEERDLTAES